MAENSTIEWTHHTFNPWWGCTKVSPGCDHCYADNMARRYGHNVWGHDAPRRFLSDANWDKPLIWNNEAAAEGARKRVFCASMADVFEVRDDLARHRQRLLRLIDATPGLDWLLLTKRPHSIKKLLPIDYQFPPQVWIGTTVENQEQADKRIKYLQDFTTASVRFLSCEPLLGPVDIRRYLQPGRNGVRIDWVICGGESEHGARPMNPEWAESLLAQCQEAGVPFLFKQWGSWGLLNPVGDVGRHQTIRLARQDGTAVQLVNVGKKAAGRDLRGRQWTEFPVPEASRT
ncbi:phage Gp37/Gp68 family protein [Caenimonas sedimenti]|uniref:Phage Gp37/Gp68 family protein n=1 Tax=Caenimonas sedimenti TaxID=2596921 RepID=A0A562ZKR3_9BURK|nr:phage Gp37/Gp68 family protein [Caenimonas sedimenti]TWO69172.1 phage Gp37/Gp68 family protein [Caenimonas sedimenti]